MEKKSLKELVSLIIFDGQNRSNFSDSLLTQGDLSRIGQQFMYGAKQSMSIQTTGGLFKNVLKLTPSANYATKLNFQRIEKSYDAINNNTSIDTLESADLAHEFNLNISATTMLYSYYNFLGEKPS